MVVVISIRRDKMVPGLSAFAHYEAIPQSRFSKDSAKAQQWVPRKRESREVEGEVIFETKIRGGSVVRSSQTKPVIISKPRL